MRRKPAWQRDGAVWEAGDRCWTAAPRDSGKAQGEARPAARLVPASLRGERSSDVYEPGPRPCGAGQQESLGRVRKHRGRAPSVSWGPGGPSSSTREGAGAQGGRPSSY